MRQSFHCSKEPNGPLRTRSLIIVCRQLGKRQKQNTFVLKPRWFMGKLGCKAWEGEKGEKRRREGLRVSILFYLWSQLKLARSGAFSPPLIQGESTVRTGEKGGRKRKKKIAQSHSILPFPPDPPRTGLKTFLYGRFFLSYLRMFGWLSLFMSWTSLSMLFRLERCLFSFRTITFPFVLWLTCKNNKRKYF